MKFSIKQVGPTATAQTKKFMSRVKSNERKVVKRIGYRGRQVMQDVLGRQGGEGRHSRPGQPPYRQSGNLQRSIRYKADENSAHVYPAKTGRAFYGDVLQWGISRTGKFRRPKTYKPGMRGPVALRNNRVIMTRLKTKKQAEAANRITALIYTRNGQRKHRTAHIDIGGARMLERYEKQVKIAARDFVTPTKRKMQPEVDRLLRQVVY